MNTDLAPAKRLLNVVLYESSLPDARKRYRGRVRRSGAPLTLENLIAHIAEEQTGVRPLIIQYCAGLLKTEILSRLALGDAVNVLDLCTVYLGVKGELSGNENDTGKAPSLVVRCVPTAELKAATRNLGVATFVKAERGARIDRVVDLFTGAVNGRISVSRSIRVEGERLCITGESPEVGVYFVSTTEPHTRIKASAAHLTRNHPKTLEFFLPDSLVRGETYYLELATQYTHGAKPLKAPRTTRSSFSLTVV